MSKRFFFIILFAFVLSGSALSYKIYTGETYLEYVKLWEYRRLHPEILPDTKSMKISVAGHTTTYADSLWISLIQYIGDNIGNGRYTEFVNPLIEKISELHPHFTKIYNIALLLSPSLNEESPEYEEKKKITEHALALGESGIRWNCDGEKLAKIDTMDFTSELWEDSTIQNPCSDSMLAYNSAMVASELGEHIKAKKYYKIASAQTEGPEASRFLGPLTDADAGNHGYAGEKFLLIAIDGYDEPPYSCQTTASKLIKNYKTLPFENFIFTLRKEEDELIFPKDTKNPLASGGSACYNTISRAIKQFYLEYITQVSEKFPEIMTGSGLLEKGIIKTIPTIKAQDGWGIIKQNGRWKYKEFM